METQQHLTPHDIVTRNLAFFVETLAADPTTDLTELDMPGFPDYLLLLDADDLVVGVRRRSNGEVRHGRRCDRGRHLFHVGDADGRWAKQDAGALLLDALGVPRPHGAHLEHLDGDPSGNRPDNVGWGTAASNAAGPKRHRVERVPVADVFRARIDIGAGLVTAEQVAERLGVSKATVSRWVTGNSLVTATNVTPLDVLVAGRSVAA